MQSGAGGGVYWHDVQLLPGYPPCSFTFAKFCNDFIYYCDSVQIRWNIDTYIITHWGWNTIVSYVIALQIGLEYTICRLNVNKLQWKQILCCNQYTIEHIHFSFLYNRTI